jgi:hypothetical protein
MKSLDWLKRDRVLASLIVLATVILTRFTVAIDEKGKLMWADWTGFGADSTPITVRVFLPI